MSETTKYNRIKAVLAEKGKTGVWLAKALGVSPITVSRWSQNTQQPDLPTLFRIAALLEVPVCELLGKGD
jgi:transcriptional regulator with XRE-family HTH domain